MDKIRSFSGYALAVLAIPVVLATFIGLDEWSGRLVALTGLKVSPWFTGGEIMEAVDHGDYQMILHRPVFGGLIAERSRGFVQVDWTPLAYVPENLRDDVDFDADGKSDLTIQLNTKTGKATVTAKNRRVLGVREVLKLSNAWMVRVNLKRH